MTTPDHTALRAVAEAATPGPWETYALPDVRPGQWTMTGVGVVGDEMGHRIETMFKDDAEFIATFDPPTVLALLDTLAAVEAVRDHYAILAGLPVHASDVADRLNAALGGGAL